MVDGRGDQAPPCGPGPCLRHQQQRQGIPAAGEGDDQRRGEVARQPAVQTNERFDLGWVYEHCAWPRAAAALDFRSALALG